MAWDKLKPAGSQKLRLADDDIRANNAALETALAFEHDFPGTGKHTSLIGIFLEGNIKGLEVSYKDPDEVYISGGVIHVNDGTDDFLLKADSQITKAITGHGQIDKPIYFYVDTPDSGETLAAADIEWSVDAPTYDHAKKGWYHPTTTDWRFIGSIPVDSGGNLIKGYRSENGNSYSFDGRQSMGNATDAWADITDLAKFAPHIDNALAILAFRFSGSAAAADWGYFSIRKNGSSDDIGWPVCSADNKDFDMSNDILRFPVDADGLIEWKEGANMSGFGWALGYWEPR